MVALSLLIFNMWWQRYSSLSMILQVKASSERKNQKSSAKLHFKKWPCQSKAFLFQLNSYSVGPTGNAEMYNVGNYKNTLQK